jgi:hypothetical protein
MVHLTLVWAALTINHRTIWRLVNNELESMGKEVVVAYFEIVCRHSPAVESGKVQDTRPPG